MGKQVNNSQTNNQPERMKRKVVLQNCVASKVGNSSIHGGILSPVSRSQALPFLGPLQVQALHVSTWSSVTLKM
jgi:hypothetical protein